MSREVKKRVETETFETETTTLLYLLNDNDLMILIQCFEYAITICSASLRTRSQAVATIADSTASKQTI